MLHPPIQPFASGLLHRGDGAEIYWETSGDPRGRPALYLHGGPGSGLGTGGYRRRFDPTRHLIVGLDQRGCGRSRPLTTDALDALHRNTTETLIADIEAVRTHLGIARWLVSGVSWGTTLALAYAQEFPEQVTELVLVAVTTTGRDEVEWITDAMGRVFPEAWERFERDSCRVAGERVVEAYARRLAGSDVDDRHRAAASWNAWEDVHISLDPNAEPRSWSGDEIASCTFATLVAHYWSNDGFLRGDRAIFRRMDRIAHIPAVLIHGRHDISGPSVTPWRLHRMWPASRLTIVEAEGHGGPEMMELMRAACDGFASPP